MKTNMSMLLLKMNYY